MKVRMSESDVRALRNRVYDHVISDNSWKSVRAHWMQPAEVQFLRDHDFPLATAHSAEYFNEHL